MLEDRFEFVLELLDETGVVVVQFGVLGLLLKLGRVDGGTVLRDVGLVEVLGVVLPVLGVRLLAAQLIGRRVEPARWAQCRH